MARSIGSREGATASGGTARALHELAPRIAHLPLVARRPMVGSVSGRHRSPTRGSSVEFAEYRSYVAGDDLRRLDWRAWGRTDRFFVKEFEADTNLRLVLVVDASGSMKYAGAAGKLAAKLDPRGGTTKLERANDMAVALAQLALKQGDAVGLHVAGGGETVPIPPRRKPSHLRLIMDRLDALDPSGDVDLAQTLHDVAERVPRRALVVVFSDLFTSPRALADAFQHLRYRRHDVSVFHLLDRDELEFRVDRPTRFVDPEGGQSIVADPATITDRYLKALARYRKDLDEAVLAADVDYRETLLDDDPAEILSRFLVGRAGKGASR